jgi:hypothetical protein
MNPNMLKKPTIPDTRIHIYSVDRGTLTTYDFSSRSYYPLMGVFDAADPRLFALTLKRCVCTVVVVAVVSDGCVLETVIVHV